MQHLYIEFWLKKAHFPSEMACKVLVFPLSIALKWMLSAAHDTDFSSGANVPLTTNVRGTEGGNVQNEMDWKD